MTRWLAPVRVVRRWLAWAYPVEMLIFMGMTVGLGWGGMALSDLLGASPTKPLSIPEFLSAAAGFIAATFMALAANEAALGMPGWILVKGREDA